MDLSSGDHRFGGFWTERKLEVLADYLRSYQTALKKTPLRRAYIDAFAGSGLRSPAAPSGEQSSQGILFPDLHGAEPQGFRTGSARRALEIEQPFDAYVFIEKDANRSAELGRLAEEYPDLADRIQVRHGEANQELQRRCKADWTGRRAVLFLDPYGMQVHWATIEAVAKTRSIDMWLLFPVGIGVNRLLPRSGDVPVAWRDKLNQLLGTENWYDSFYEVQPERTLFGDEDPVVAKRGVEAIGRYFVERLKTAFPAVSENPGVLMNSRNCPLYLLCFAAANERGGQTALRIANHLLKGLR